MKIRVSTENNERTLSRIQAQAHHKPNLLLYLKELLLDRSHSSETVALFGRKLVCNQNIFHVNSLTPATGIVNILISL